MKKDAFVIIGLWFEVKLDIVRKYASAYSRIISARAEEFYLIYMRFQKLAYIF